MVRLAGHLHARGFTLLDAQIQNPHLARLGVFEVRGEEYAARLHAALGQDVSLSGPPLSPAPMP